MFAQDTLIYWIENDLLTFMVSVMLGALLIPKIILIAFRRQLFDEVNERKIHKGYVPRLGGISFFPAYFFSLVLVVALNLRCGGHLMAEALKPYMVPVYLQFCAIILLYLVGIADDLVGVRYKAKFVIQIICALLLVCAGMTVNNFYGILWLHELPAWISWIFTAFAVVFVVNAINLIDGIDGLASGLSGIALVFYSTVFFTGGKYLYSMLAAATAGPLIPFFYYNVFGKAKKQNKILMGDTGALTTGMMLAFCAIAIICMRPEGLDINYNPAIVAISPLIVPCFDVCRVYFHRVKYGRNPFLPDKAHIHHKLLALGMNQTWALLSIVLTSLAFTGVNILLSPFTDPNIILAADILAWTFGNILLTRAIRRRERRLGHVLYQ